MKESRLFAGYIDYWDGRTVGGWAVDRSRPGLPCDVDIYLDGEFVRRVRADQHRENLKEVSPADQRKGFFVEVSAASRPTAYVEVRLADTAERLPAMNEEMAARLGRPRIDLRSPNDLSSRWTPIPPAALITHVTRETGEEAYLRRIYRRTGFSQAADIYNTLLDLGADPHRPGYSIVDLGCGCGRLATFLAQWLEDARFLGVDIWRAGIEWATRHITSTYEAYRFHCPVADEKGYEGAEHYRVPVDRESVDLVISNSLFTHLDVGACDSYLREAGRILKPGGNAFLTFFLRDDASVGTMESMARRSNLPLVKDAKAWYYGSDGYLDVFHDRERILSVATDAKLRPVLHRRGAWHGPADLNTNPIAFQDVLILAKA